MTKDIIPWKCHICKGEFSTPDGGICSRCSRATCRDHLHQIGAKKLEATWVCTGCLTSEEKSKSNGSSMKSTIMKFFKPESKWNAASRMLGFLFLLSALTLGLTERSLNSFVFFGSLSVFFVSIGLWLKPKLLRTILILLSIALIGSTVYTVLTYQEHYDQRIDIADVTKSQVLILQKKPDQGNIVSMNIHCSGKLEGAAQLVLMLNGAPYKDEFMKGKVNFTWGGDWYSDSIELRYQPSSITSGQLIIDYSFYTL